MHRTDTHRHRAGLHIVGADLVEISPPYDMAGNTAVAGAGLLFEMLCALPGVKRNGKGAGSDIVF